MTQAAIEANAQRRPLDVAAIVPPHDLEAEAMLLGSLVWHPASFSTAEVVRLQPRCFWYEPHQAFFSVLCRMRDDGVPISETPILAHRLVQSGVMAMLGGQSEMRKILDSVANGAHARYYADIVFRLFQQRQRLDLSIELATCVQRGDDPEDIDATIKLFQEATAEPPVHEVELLTAAELAEGDFRISYHVPGILAKGQPCIVAAGHKNLKTSIIAGDLAVSLAAGRPFLGKFEVEPAKVLVMSGESGRVAMQDVCLRVAESKGVVLSAVQGFMFTDWIPQLDSDADLLQLRCSIERAQAEVVILDPAYLMIPGADASNLFVIGRMLGNLTKVAREANATPILIHHTKGGTGRETGTMPELSDIAWAGFKEYARQWLLFSRRTLYRPGTGHHELWMTVGGSAGHGGGWALDIDEGEFGDRYWATGLRSIDEASREAQQARATDKLTKQEEAKRIALEQAAERAVGMLKLSDEPLTLAAIRSKTGWNGIKAREVGEFVVAQGIADWVKVKTRGGATDALKLNPGHDGQPWSEDGPDHGSKAGQSRGPIRAPDQTNQGEGE